MGTYLSTPITDKCEEEGAFMECTTTPVAWGVVDMQGWRKSMEDAHIATANQEYKVFGVFDGHGGPEVARLCQLYLVSALTQQPTWTKALQNEPYDGNPAKSPLGVALREGFHSLDRIIADPNRRDELIGLRTYKPAPGEQKVADNIPPPRPENIPGASSKETNDGALQQPASAPGVSLVDQGDKTSSLVGELSFSNDNTNDGVNHQQQPSPLVNASVLPGDQVNRTSVAVGELCPPSIPSTAVLASPPEMPKKDGLEEAVEEEKKGEDELVQNTCDNDDSDSEEAVGHEQAAEQDRNLDDSEEGSEEALEEASPTSGRVSDMFHRLLHMSGAAGTNAGQMPFKVTTGAAVGEPSLSSPPQPLRTTPSGLDGKNPYTFSASALDGGRMICTLPDHPIHAGATAVVAVMVGKTVVVANAGDSRAVLCREGAAFALSYDHKPQQDVEMNRIRKAGGFVNQFGRVNGNLNLSRSIGDLKYKQAYFLPPAEQMISAEPDIIKTQLDETDEFILIGCDGIWDCLTNEQAVEYVRKRIDTNTPVEIGKEMLDEIISVDPRATQGIGGDNMTFMIVDLQPERRSYNEREE